MKLKIKDFREEAGLTQSELAKKIGNVQRNVSNWENGVSEPDCQSILQLAQLFDVSIDELFGREDIYANKDYASALDRQIMQYIRNLNDAQKLALMQLLREIR